MTPPHEPILVVDDDPACCQSIAAALLKAGYHVEATTEPLQALWRTMNRRYALVISDLEMPDLNGIRLLGQLRHGSPDTPAILVSGFADAHTLEQARALGAVVLSKPFGVDAVLATVRAALDANAEEGLTS
jgi:DNA-binding NtrC family response regulator